MLKGGRKRWGTDDPPIQLIPDAWQSIPVTIEFPDFPKDVAYGFNLSNSGPPLNITSMLGISVAKILPQELTLPNIVLGTVPSSLINYVDWRVVLNWSKRPDNCGAWPVMSPVRRGVQTDLRGGSGLLEISAAFRRMIHVGLSGQNIILSRRQSSQDTLESVNWSPGNATHFPSGGPRPGWTWGTSQRGRFVRLIDQRAGGNNVWRGGSNGASLTDPSDHSSRWTGTLLVKPGRYNTSI